MNALDWLVGHRFEALRKREHDWAFVFSDKVGVVVACLWRLLEDDCIKLTSQDDGHQFGRPAPVECVGEVNSKLGGAMVARVDLRERILDLRIQFDSGMVIELLPDSSGYEAWQVDRTGQSFIAAGGGKLVVFEDNSVD